uniref:ATP synthase complex subunit 8 n=1 Tax=Neotrogla sp. 5 KY-2017 TaxID=2051645 RepID=A0A343QCB2_9NEOP|nr:ATP synthase F0 subunit 8 [Neotrogla sp. 5 KY-2017]
MPQMAPIWWTTLFILSSILFIMINSLNFWFLSYNFKKSNLHSISSKNFKWTW